MKKYYDCGLDGGLKFKFVSVEKFFIVLGIVILTRMLFTCSSSRIKQGV